MLNKLALRFSPQVWGGPRTRDQKKKKKKTTNSTLNAKRVTFNRWETEIPEITSV